MDGEDAKGKMNEERKGTSTSTASLRNSPARISTLEPITVNGKLSLLWTVATGSSAGRRHSGVNLESKL
jgi:hypothetical protein